MDDLNSTLGAILNDPDKMAQLRSVAESLGLNPGGGAPSPPSQQNTAPAGGSGSPGNSNGNGGIDAAAIASILQNFQNGGNAGTGGDASSSGNSQVNLGAISKVAQVLSTFNQSDKNVELLRTLKPHFSAARASRIDDAVRIMQLLKAWPALRDSGLLSSLGNLGGLGNLGNLGNLFGGGRR